jgi:hypothetical protein
MGKAKIILTSVGVLALLVIIIFLLCQVARRQASHQQAMSFFTITNSPLGLAISKGSDGRLFCQLFENGHSISELYPLSSVVPFRHYKWFVDEKTTCVSNIVTISWLAEDGWDGDPYRLVVDLNTHRLIAGSNVWSVAGY